MTIAKRIFLVTTVLVSCVGCDQTTKSVAQSFLSETDVWSLWGDTVRLQLAYNSGAFLSLGATLPEAWREGIFSVGTSGLLLVLLGFALFSKSASSLEILAYSLMLAGGVGNLIDRMMNSYVVDFINIGVGSLRTGVFNLADIAVSLGVLMLITGTLRDKTKNV
jgi:signal peptidase II